MANNTLLIWISNSTNIETTLSHPWVSTSANVLVAIATGVLALYTYKLARSNDLTVKNSQNQLEELKKQYKISNMREKAKLIDTTTIPTLKQKIAELCTHLDKKTYIKKDNIQKEPLLKLVPNHFVDAIRDDNIFKIINEKIVLTYTEDNNLVQHMNIAIGSLNDYRTNACNLEKLIKSAYDSKPPDSFIQALDKICTNESKVNCVGNVIKPYDLKDSDFFALYFLAMTGSKNAYKSGHSDVIKLLDKHFEELQSAATIDSESHLVFNEIQTELSDIRYNLTNAFDEIQKLHELWQNDFII